VVGHLSVYAVRRVPSTKELNILLGMLDNQFSVHECGALVRYRERKATGGCHLKVPGRDRRPRVY
jgi:hypothetical protein